MSEKPPKKRKGGENPPVPPAEPAPNNREPETETENSGANENSGESGNTQRLEAVRNALAKHSTSEDADSEEEDLPVYKPEPLKPNAVADSHGNDGPATKTLKAGWGIGKSVFFIFLTGLVVFFKGVKEHMGGGKAGPATPKKASGGHGGGGDHGGGGHH